MTEIEATEVKREQVDITGLIEEIYENIGMLAASQNNSLAGYKELCKALNNLTEAHSELNKAFEGIVKITDELRSEIELLKDEAIRRSNVHPSLLPFSSGRNKFY